ncbi:MAG: hypothetical protein N3A69_02865, partial [Leptospiraceae bacterium]|nr:hypothetical protein [Leptospiraceae bacterium]
QINILLGMDVLKNLNFLVNWDKKIIIFSSAPFRLDGILVELELSMNIPTLSLLIDGTEVKVVLDTGSKLSYLEKHFTANRTSLGKASDFSPGFGLFETDTFEVPVTLANQTFSMKVGHLPKLLQQTLKTSQAQGILGNEIFQYFHVCFNFQDKKLLLLTK